MGEKGECRSGEKMASENGAMQASSFYSGGPLLEVGFYCCFDQGPRCFLSTP
jgi:hypothetical protein